MNIWHEDVFKSGTKKDNAIRLNKNDIIWPMMVIATDIERCDEQFADFFDSGVYDEIVRQYKETIDSCCERCEFFIKVLCDYNEYRTSKSLSKKCLDFAINKWKDYLPEFEIENVDEETLRGLIQIVLYNIVRNRIMIDKIKKGVKL